MTEEIIVSFDELKILKKCRKSLECHFGVKIRAPELPKHNSNDLFVVSVLGRAQNINYVKEFLKKEVMELAKKRQACSTIEDNCVVITLSDSDSDSTVLTETQNQKKRKKKQSRIQYAYGSFDSNKKRKTNHTSCTISKSEFTEGGPFSSAITTEVPQKDTTEIPKDAPNNSEHDDSIVVISENINPRITKHASLIGVQNDLPKEDKQITLTKDSIQVSIDYTPSDSTVTESVPKETSENADDSIIILSENVQPSSSADFIPVPPASDFMPLRTRSKRPKVGNVSSIEVAIPRPTLKRVLRPIVIDGSNVARLHGEVNNTFSCKGIQISIEYFLKRGHTEVTAFVPQFRRHSRNFVPTTDQHILEELARTQNVVFTPSRRVNGRPVVCYDDRFIVDLASKNGGVILSNDNYRDIMEESPIYRKTIEERLLMYCFVGDILMIPEDPLGRDGPKLDEFLSKEETVNENPSNLQVIGQMLVDHIKRIAHSST